MEHIKVNLVPGGVPSICHVSQYDDGRSIMIHLYNGDSVYTLAGTEIVKVKVIRRDGVTNEYSVTNTSDSYIILDTTFDMCLCAGYSECKVVITNGSTVIGSADFKMYVEADIYSDGRVIRTASGQIANFETNLTDDLLALDVNIEPVQDLHGYDYPWPAGAGKNMAYFSDDNLNSTRGASVTYDDTYNDVKITSTAAWTRAVFEIPCPENTTVTVSFKGSCTSNYKRVQFFPNANLSSQYKNITITDQEALYSTTFTTNAGTDTIYVCFYTATEIVGGDMIIKDFQIEKRSSASAFNPYVNVCPITGRSSITINRAGSDMEPVAPTPITIQIGQTVYKGVFYAVLNKILVTHVLIDIGTVNWNKPNNAKYFITAADFEVDPKGTAVDSYSNDISSHYKGDRYSNIVNGTVPSGFTIPSTVKRLYLYDQTKKDLTAQEFKAAMSGVVIVYEISEPYYIDVAGSVSIPTLNGVNNVFSDAGNTKVEYYDKVYPGG